MQLKGFKFVTTLVLVFKKIEKKIKQRMTLFIQNTIITNIKRSLEKGSGSIIDLLLVCQTIIP